jgi:hypothetical protein
MYPGILIMTLKDAPILLSGYRTQQKSSTSQDELLESLALKAFKQDLDFISSPEALVDAIEACSTFIIEEVRPFTVEGKAIICSEMRASRSLKVLLGLAEPIHLLKDLIPCDKITPAVKQRVSAVLAMYWNHLQFLGSLKRSSVPEFQVTPDLNHRQVVQEGKVGGGSLTPKSTHDFKIEPKNFLEAHIALEAAFIIALDAVLAGDVSLHGIADPFLLINQVVAVEDGDDICPLTCQGIIAAICHDVHLPTALIHTHVEHAWACAQGRRPVPVLSMTLRRVIHLTQLYFFEGKFVVLNKSVMILALTIFGCCVLLILFIIYWKYCEAE